MGTVAAYICDRCPLAFEVGEYAYWNLSGRTIKAVCGGCGTMHRLEIESGSCHVFALSGPVRSLPLVTLDSAWNDGRQYQEYKWPFAESDWKVVAEYAAAPKLDELACSRCGAASRLVSLEAVGLFGEEHCPVCDGPLAPAYFDTVN